MILPGWSLAELDAAVQVAATRRQVAVEIEQPEVAQRQTEWIDRLLDARLEREQRR